MRKRELARVKKRLDGFLEELTAPMGRAERRQWAGAYVRGLLLDGERKSVEPIAARVLGAEPHSAPVQALQQFVNQSPWPAALVEQALARRFEASLGAAQRYWIIDETSFPKAGSHSAGVARQYCGALGKLANCQVAVSLHAAETSLARSQPLGWKLFLPPEWQGEAAGERRRAAGIPPPVGARTKPELALDLLDLARERGGATGTVLADEVYGGSFAWRAALRARGLAYVVAAGSDSRVWTQAPIFALRAPRRAGGRQPSRPRLVGDTPVRLDALAKGLPTDAWRKVIWREGTRGPQSSRFARVETAWAAHHWSKWPQPERVAETLLIEWPEEEEAPTKFWLAWGEECEKAPPPVLAAAAKGRWRVEQDYRELKDELGLDHFEGRSLLGWQHHVTLVSMAFAFLREEQARRATRPKKARADADPARGAPAPASGPRSPLRPLSLVQDSLPQHIMNLTLYYYGVDQIQTQRAADEGDAPATAERLVLGGDPQALGGAVRARGRQLWREVLFGGSTWAGVAGSRATYGHGDPGASRRSLRATRGTGHSSDSGINLRRGEDSFYLDPAPAL